MLPGKVLTIHPIPRYMSGKMQHTKGRAEDRLWCEWAIHALNIEHLSERLDACGIVAIVDIAGILREWKLLSSMKVQDFQDTTSHRLDGLEKTTFVAPAANSALIDRAMRALALGDAVGVLSDCFADGFIFTTAYVG